MNYIKGKDEFYAGGKRNYIQGERWTISRRKDDLCPGGGAMNYIEGKDELHLGRKMNYISGERWTTSRGKEELYPGGKMTYVRGGDELYRGERWITSGEKDELYQWEKMNYIQGERRIISRRKDELYPGVKMNYFEGKDELYPSEKMNYPGENLQSYQQLRIPPEAFISTTMFIDFRRNIVSSWWLVGTYLSDGIQHFGWDRIKRQFWCFRFVVLYNGWVPVEDILKVFSFQQERTLYLCAMFDYLKTGLEKRSYSLFYYILFKTFIKGIFSIGSILKFSSFSRPQEFLHYPEFCWSSCIRDLDANFFYHWSIIYTHHAFYLRETEHLCYLWSSLSIS